MYTIEQMAAIGGLTVIGSSVLIWCCKMQWDQNAIGKLVKKLAEQFEEISKKVTTLESQMKVMEGKYDFMCELVMDDVKQRRHDLWEHHSPLKPTEAARAMIPDDIMAALREYNGNESSCIHKALYISGKVTTQRLSVAANERGLSLLEFMTLITDIDVDH